MNSKETKEKKEEKHPTPVVTYGEALRGHKYKWEILAILHVDDPDSPVKMPAPTYRESHNKKTTRNIDTYEYIQRSLRGLCLWWNCDE